MIQSYGIPSPPILELFLSCSDQNEQNDTELQDTATPHFNDWMLQFMKTTKANTNLGILYFILTAPSKIGYLKEKLKTWVPIKVT